MCQRWHATVLQTLGFYIHYFSCDDYLLAFQLDTFRGQQRP